MERKSRSLGGVQADLARQGAGGLGRPTSNPQRSGGNAEASNMKAKRVNSLPEMLVQLRLALGMNQKQLAEALNCSPQFICDMERGKRVPSVTFIDRICTYLNRGSKGCQEWHAAAARAHGWKIDEGP